MCQSIYHRNIDNQHMNFSSNNLANELFRLQKKGKHQRTLVMVIIVEIRPDWPDSNIDFSVAFCP